MFRILKDIIANRLGAKSIIGAIDIGFVYCIYFGLALVLARLTDYTVGPFDSKVYDARSSVYIISGLLLYCWYIGIVIFLVRNLVIIIPFPLDGVYGYSHKIIDEDIKEGMIFVTLFILFQTNFQDKLKYIMDKYVVKLAPNNLSHNSSNK